MASLTYDQQKDLIGQQEGMYGRLLDKQAANRPWVQKNPGTAMGLAGGLAGTGGLLSGLLSGGGLFGRKERREQVPMFSPEIMQLKNQMAPTLWNQLMGDQFDFGPIEQLSRQNFQSKTLPSIMNRFNMGDNRSSGNLLGAIGAAGSSLDAQLAAMRQMYGLQRQHMLSSLMGYSMQPSFNTDYRPRQEGGIEQGFGALTSLLPFLLAAV